MGHYLHPWGIALQIIALVHLVRRRGAYYWFFIIFFGGFVGAIAYILVEILPDAYLLRTAFDGYSRRARIKVVETSILGNPSVANYEELGDLLREEKQFAKAREAYDRAISIRSDSEYTFYHRALCALELNDFVGAVPDLELAVNKDARFDSYRAAALLAHAYAVTGNVESAGTLFADVSQYSTTPETFYNYASFLKSQNRLAEAREWAQKLLDKKRTMPRYFQRIERLWFVKAKTLLKELPAA
jgi:hypothetical protein